MHAQSPLSPLIYAVGDVHGRADLLEDVLDFIARDSVRREQEPKVVFLGDIVDRGPQSRQALDLVTETLTRWPRSRLILGNHDDLFLEFLNGAEPTGWLHQGGRETLWSYDPMPIDNEFTRSEILEYHPQHVRILREATVVDVEGAFAFVHAGIDPERTIEQQSRTDCMWIREPFLDHVGSLSHVIVHGHSPMVLPPRPVVTENRISMDTGAVQTGVLSVLVIDRAADRLEFHATIDGDVAPIEPVAMDRGYGVAVWPRDTAARSPS